MAVKNQTFSKLSNQFYELKFKIGQKRYTCRASFSLESTTFSVTSRPVIQFKSLAELMMT